jgi:UDP-4-amino-4,6-dideoxy-N-acetyl-beta-L-altrosamine transaminase
VSIPPTVLPYGRQTVDEADIAAVADVLRGDFLTTGPTVDAYEAAFADKVSAPFAIACSSGTAGLHLAALALGLGPGDVVIVPTVTFLASANCAAYVGADVAFADVDPATGLLTPATAREAATRAQRDGLGPIKAIVAVHLNGHCVDVPGLAEAFPGIPIIEDACHALGASTTETDGSQTPVGACLHSAMAMFSTHPVKTVATGEGGMLTTRDPGLAKRLRRLRNHGMERDPELWTESDISFDTDGSPNPWAYEMPEPGYNYRLSDIHAALGLSQIRKLEGFVETRRRLRARYVTALDGLAARTNHAVRPLPTASGCNPAWHLSVVLIDFAAFGMTRAKVMKRLREHGVGSQVHYTPVHLQPYFRRRHPDLTLPGADTYYSRCLSLPLYPALTEADVDRVVATLADVLGIA